MSGCASTGEVGRIREVVCKLEARVSDLEGERAPANPRDATVISVAAAGDLQHLAKAITAASRRDQPTDTYLVRFSSAMHDQLHLEATCPRVNEPPLTAGAAPPAWVYRCRTCGSRDQVALLYGIPPKKWWRLLAAARAWTVPVCDISDGYWSSEAKAVIAAVKDMQP